MPVVLSLKASKRVICMVTPWGWGGEFFLVPFNSKRVLFLIFCFVLTETVIAIVRQGKDALNFYI